MFHLKWLSLIPFSFTAFVLLGDFFFLPAISSLQLLSSPCCTPADWYFSRLVSPHLPLLLELFAPLTFIAALFSVLSQLLRRHSQCHSLFSPSLCFINKQLIYFTGPITCARLCPWLPHTVYHFILKSLSLYLNSVLVKCVLQVSLSNKNAGKMYIKEKQRQHWKHNTFFFSILCIKYGARRHV